MTHIPDSVLEKLPQWGYWFKPREFPFCIDPESGVIQSVDEDSQNLGCYVGWSLLEIDNMRYTREIFESKNTGPVWFYCKFVGKIANIKFAVGMEGKESHMVVNNGSVMENVFGVKWDGRGAVTHVHKDSQARRKGVKQGWFFLTVNGKPFESWNQDHVDENEKEWDVIAWATMPLRVTVQECTDLGYSINNPPGPMCTCRVVPTSPQISFYCQHSILSTNIIPKTNHPQWNFEGELWGYHRGCGLEFYVKDAASKGLFRDNICQFELLGSYITDVIGSPKIQVQAKAGCQARLSLQVDQLFPPDPGPEPDLNISGNIDQVPSDPDLRLPAHEIIERTRDKLHHAGGTVFWSHIIVPVAAHGSHLIYAPDEVAWHLVWKVYVLSKGWRGTRNRDAATKRCKCEGVGRQLKDRACVMLTLPVALYMFYTHAAAITCFMQNAFLGWADQNRGMNFMWRFGSISLMMIVRLVVSNILPFTSPAFAFLIAKSQPEGQEGLGTVYLLLCSMPAGAVVPLFDKLLEKVYAQFHPDYPTQSFLFTHYASVFTDHLPFSFWVRPFFMEPAFAAAQIAGSADVSAAAAAVLAGHFMIWSGAPTTMHQRKFLPDWLTCVLIQPLGLFEDVAVVLATWAGATAQSQKQAQIALYTFMLFMNVVQYFSTKRQKEVEQEARNNPKPELSTATGQPSPRQTGGSARKDDEVLKYLHEEDCSQKDAFMSKWRHITVAVLTIFVIIYTSAQDVEQGPMTTTTTTTTSPQHAPLCKSEHTNVKAVMGTVVVVSGEAVVFSLAAKGFVHLLWWIKAKRTAAAREGRIGNRVASCDDATAPLLGSA